MHSNPRLENKPIVPTTSGPAFLTPDGNPCYGAQEEYHFRCFDLFREFGAFINRWRDSTPFRLQELQDTKITYREGDVDLGPNYGHRYDIYYYQLNVGLLQIYAHGVTFVCEHDTKEDQVQRVGVHICLNTFLPTIIPFDDVRKYLYCIARMTTSDTKQCFYTEHQYQGFTELRYAFYAIDEAMMRVMWNNRNVDDEKVSPMIVWFAGAPTDWYKYLATQN
jgi:hypothetical protein